MAERNRRQHRPHYNIRRRDYFSNNPSNLNQSTTNNTKTMQKYSNNKNNIAKPSSASTSNNFSKDDDQQNDMPNLVGTCPFMCPVDERVQRERLRDLAVFERLHGDPSRSSPQLAVKKFCRTITTKHVQASDVRPLSVLEETLNHLFNLWHSSEYPFEVIHDFIFDRTRSIRQDLSMQNLSNDQVISMYEKMVKFHVVSELKFRRSNSSPVISSKSYLNMEQLTKTLITLYSLYEANRSLESTYENEAEYLSLYVLLHLQSDGQRESLPLWLRYVPSLVMKSKEMRFALNVLRYYRLGNYKRFICIVEAEASCLQYCILVPSINEVRASAISCVNYGGYKLHPFPLLDLSKLLMMKVSDLESLCKDCGLQTSSDEAGNTFLPTKQTGFVKPKGELQKFYPLDSKRLEGILAAMSEL